MLRREGLHAIEGKQDLKRQRLLGPQRAVVVEGGNALGHRHEVGSALLGHAGDEIDDRLLGSAVVPGRQRIGRRRRCRGRGRRRRVARRGLPAASWRQEQSQNHQAQAPQRSAHAKHRLPARFKWSEAQPLAASKNETRRHCSSSSGARSTPSRREAVSARPTGAEGSCSLPLEVQRGVMRPTAGLD